jgi:hypothetical protein
MTVKLSHLHTISGEGGQGATSSLVLEIDRGQLETASFGSANSMRSLSTVRIGFEISDLDWTQAISSWRHHMHTDSCHPATDQTAVTGPSLGNGARQLYDSWLRGWSVWRLTARGG